MDQRMRLLLAAANDDGFAQWAAPVARRSFSVEIGRCGVFVSLWRFDIYLCAESESAWAVEREPGGIDAQLWRLHLMVSRAPK